MISRAVISAAPGVYTNGLTGRGRRRRPSLSRKICGSDKVPSLECCSYSERLNKDAIWCYYMSRNDKPAISLRPRYGCQLYCQHRMKQKRFNVIYLLYKETEKAINCLLACG